MASIRLQIWFDREDVPESAHKSQDALVSFFLNDPNITSAMMAYVTTPNSIYPTTGPAGYGFVTVKQIPENRVFAGILCCQIIQFMMDGSTKTIYKSP